MAIIENCLRNENDNKRIQNMLQNAIHPFVSVVVPLFNEEESVEPLYRQVSTALRALARPYEIILVDDGSSDRTFAAAASLAGDDPCLLLRSG